MAKFKSMAIEDQNQANENASLFIKNVPPELSQNDFVEFFVNNGGSIKNLTIKPNPKGHYNKLYVTFNDSRSARKILNM